MAEPWHQIRTGSGPEVELWSLVLQAVDIDHRLRRGEMEWELWCPESKVLEAEYELASFEVENAVWPPSEIYSPALKTGPLPVLSAAALSIFYAFTGPWGGALSRAGDVNRQAILNHGEWWRLVTGLTLHADFNHLLGNVVIGALVMYYLAQETGGGAACLLAVVVGAAANLCNTLLQADYYQSLGFSTSVFAMIGAMAGMRITNWDRGLKAALGPLGAGLALLAMLGMGGRHTDVGAHAWGLALGVPAGILCRVVRNRSSALSWSGWQSLWGMCALLIVTGAWYLAWP
ncbi:rhomboid family intramembrane serine protease [Desulfobacterota bacterium M19]